MEASLLTKIYNKKLYALKVTTRNTHNFNNYYFEYHKILQKLIKTKRLLCFAKQKQELTCLKKA